MAELKTLYTSNERVDAKIFLEAKCTLLTEAVSKFYQRWVTVDGDVWVECDDLLFYTLFRESSFRESS